MSNRVRCPRCDQDWLVRVELVAMKRLAITCPECDALWLNEQDVKPPIAGVYGVTWFDLATFIEQSGASYEEGAVNVIGPLLR